MSHFYDPDLESELRDAGRMVAPALEPEDEPARHVWIPDSQVGEPDNDCPGCQARKRDADA